MSIGRLASNSTKSVGTQKATVTAGEALINNVFYWVAVAASSGIFLRDCFAGPARYYLDISGLAPAWFIVDGLAAVSVLIAAISYRTLSDPVGVLVLFGAVVLASLNGFLSTQSLEATFSGLKMILPLLFGLVCRNSVFRIFEKGWIVFAVFIAMCGGVLYNINGDFPWTNYTFFVGNIERSATVSRWIEEVSRINGFASDSNMAGFLIVVCAFFLIKGTPILFKLFVYGLSGTAIYFTTSRTSLLSLVAILAADILIFLFRWVVGLKYAQAVRLVYYFLCSTPFLIPIISVLSAQSADLHGLPSFLDSYIERATVSWVVPFARMQEFFFPHGYVIGYGVGMVGYPVQFSAWAPLFDIYYDNFALGIYLMFGLPGLLYFIFLIFRKGQIARSRSSLTLIGVLLFYGTTVQGFGTATFCVLIGALLSPFDDSDASALIAPRPPEPARRAARALA